MPFLSALLVFGSLSLFSLWYLRSKNVMEERVRSLSAQRRAQAEADDPFSQRVMFPAVQGLMTRFANVLPTALIGQSRRWLTVSNSTMSLPTFLGIVLVATTLPAAAMLVLLIVGTGGSPGRAIIFVPLVGLLGFAFPVLFLRSRANRRQNDLWKQLPDSLDLLTTCVEAGLSLDFAFQRVAERQGGPVGFELNRMLREKALGQTRKEALTGMAERINLPDVNVFVNSVVQAETLGTSIGQVLRVQARQLRIRRRQHAEELARQAAPKMVFPLVFFVLPSLFIVILGPLAISAFELLSD
jgi:tight adherence protein C